MEVWPVLLSDWRVLVRRWYVVVVGLLITLGLCLGAARLVPTQYTVDSTVLLLPPATVVDGRAINPYLSLGGLEGVADVLSAALGDVSVEQAVEDAGWDATYLFGRDPAAAGPVLVLDVTGAAPADALGTQDIVLDRLPATLERLQESVGVAVATRVTSTVVTRGAEPEPDHRGLIRAVLVAAVAGLAATYLGAALLDRGLRARRRSVAVQPTPVAVSANGGSPPLEGAQAVVTMRRSGTESVEDPDAVSRTLRWTGEPR